MARKQPNNPQADTTIRVRDRRAIHQYSIQNRVFDDWLPIIGKEGYALYSFYVRCANREDERSYPGYATLQHHLGIGRSTISDTNRLLEWCGLIQIVPGDSSKTNDYYILDAPECTPALLAEVAAKIKQHYQADYPKRKVWLKRIEEWSRLFDKPEAQTKVTIVKPEGSPGVGLPQSCAGTRVVPAQDSNNPKEQSERTSSSPPHETKNETPAATSDDDDTPVPSQVSAFLAEFIKHKGSLNKAKRAVKEHSYTLAELERLKEHASRHYNPEKGNGPIGLFMTMVCTGQRASSGRRGDAGPRRKRLISES